MGEEWWDIDDLQYASLTDPRVSPFFSELALVWYTSLNKFVADYPHDVTGPLGWLTVADITHPSASGAAAAAAASANPFLAAAAAAASASSSSAPLDSPWEKEGRVFLAQLGQLHAEAATNPTAVLSIDALRWWDLRGRSHDERAPLLPL